MAKRFIQFIFLLGWLDFLFPQREDGKSLITETQEDEGHVQCSNLWIASVEEPHWELECFMDFLRQLSRRCNYVFFRAIYALHSVPIQCSRPVKNR